MSANTERNMGIGWNRWRIARWTMAAGMLLTPLVMMQFVPGWNWTIGDFLFAGTMIGGVGLLYELAVRVSSSRAFRAGAAVALGASFLLVWSTLVRDDGNGIGFFLIVMAAGVGAFAGRLNADSLARTMLGVAVMQAMFGLAAATAPVVSKVPGASMFYIFYSCFFCLLWLVSAGLFRAAAHSEAARSEV